MPSRARETENARIALRPTPQMVRRIDQLVRLGIFGLNRAEVVNNLLTVALRLAIQSGLVQLTLMENSFAVAAGVKARRRAKKTAFPVARTN